MAKGGGGSSGAGRGVRGGGAREQDLIDELFTPFEGANAADKWGQQAGSAWASKLSPDELTAMQKWTYYPYRQINDRLRGLNTPDNKVFGDTEEVRSWIAGIDGAMQKSVAPRNMVAYRGIAWDKLYDRFLPGGDLRKPGSVMTEPGFTSTTFNHERAQYFVDRPRPGHIMATIEIPKGTRGGYVSIDRFNAMQEWEFLLDRNSRFRVTKVTVPAGATRGSEIPIHVTFRVEQDKTSPPIPEGRENN